MSSLSHAPSSKSGAKAIAFFSSSPSFSLPVPSFIEKRNYCRGAAMRDRYEKSCEVNCMHAAVDPCHIFLIFLDCNGI